MWGHHINWCLSTIFHINIFALQFDIVAVSGASVLSKDGFVAPTFDEGCTLLLPTNRLFAPTVTDDATQEVLVPIQDKRSAAQHYVHIDKDRNIIVNCGRKDALSLTSTFNYMRLKCVRGNEFQSNEDDLVLLSEGIECRKLSDREPTPIVYKNGTCLETGTNFDVDFETDDLPRKYYSSCVDESTSGTFYSLSYIDGESIANGLSETLNRPSFKGKEFYPFDINKAYQWGNVFEHLSDLLGSEKLVDKYFPNNQYHFSRGHLFPNADAVKRHERRATFYYVNTVPQWQILNGGNWALVEREVRNYAKNQRKTLEVVTGSYNITTLYDENNNEVPIWLTRDKDGVLRVPVPKFVWKVVHDPDENSAVAIVQVNNPWVFDADNDILCTDVCSRLSWLKSSKFRDIRKGYTYCCDVNELRRTISFIPPVKYTSLLGGGELIDDGGEDSGFEDDDDEDPDNYVDESLSLSNYQRVAHSRYGIVGYNYNASVHNVADMLENIRLD